MSNHFHVVYREMRQERDTETDPVAGTSALTDSQIKKLAETALQLEHHFGQPQDIEWSFDHQGQLYILQSRPIPVSKKIDLQRSAAKDGDE